MKKSVYSAILALLITIISPSSGFHECPDYRPSSAYAANTDETTEIPLSFKSIIGTWSLKYSGNYGYTFSFYPNYRALVVLYLNNEALVFKGVYTIEDKNKLKINISEMKNEHHTSGINMYKGFVKAQSSYFMFGGYKVKKSGRETLILKPLAIIIDGNNSEGYFEPLMKLAKS
jgi:hypothetical protein